MAVDFKEVVAQLARSDPNLRGTGAKLTTLFDQSKETQVEPFFEPVAAILIKKGEHELLDVSAQHLTSWTQHISASTLCRMRTLEAPIVEHLLAGRTLAALVLLRSHFEAASMAAYCLEQLTAAAR